MHDTKKYQLKVFLNKRLKHSYITIAQKGEVIIKTPYDSQPYIDKLLFEKREWIEKQFLKLESQVPLADEELYSIEYIQNRVLYFSKLMGLNFSQLKFKKLKSRWGSCSSQRVITLNSELTKVAKELIDYVVVHELSHLKHMNHSKDFHKLVESYLSGSQKLRKELQRV